MESPKVSRVAETIWLIYPASINCQSFPLPCREATVPSKSLKMLSTWAARAVHWHQIHQIRQHFKSYMLSVPEHWRPAWISMNVNDSEWRTPMINMHASSCFHGDLFPSHFEQTEMTCCDLLRNVIPVDRLRELQTLEHLAFPYFSLPLPNLRQKWAP